MTPHAASTSPSFPPFGLVSNFFSECERLFYFWTLPSCVCSPLNASRIFVPAFSALHNAGFGTSSDPISFTVFSHETLSQVCRHNRSKSILFFKIFRSTLHVLSICAVLCASFTAAIEVCLFRRPSNQKIENSLSLIVSSLVQNASDRGYLKPPQSTRIVHMLGPTLVKLETAASI